MWFSWQRIRLQCGRPGFDPWVGKIPWRRERLSTPISWPGEFHGLLWARIVDFPSPGDLPNLGIEPRSPTLQENSLPAELSEKPQGHLYYCENHPREELLSQSSLPKAGKNEHTKDGTCLIRIHLLPNTHKQLFLLLDDLD